MLDKQLPPILLRVTLERLPLRRTPRPIARLVQVR
jgi:hypothetical protein